MSVDAEETQMPPGLLHEEEGRKLHLGGTVRKDGWEVMNALPGDHVDHLGDIRDLTRFEPESFRAVYASHILEHLGYMKDLRSVVRGVARILVPGGKFFVSVPDLATLSRLFSAPATTSESRFALMRMMFGGQVDEYDFHYVGLWDEYLAAVLFQCGFGQVFRVPRFGLFDDTSDLVYLDELISLNMVGLRAPEPSP